MIDISLQDPLQTLQNIEFRFRKNFGGPRLLLQLIILQPFIFMTAFIFGKFLNLQKVVSCLKNIRKPSPMRYKYIILLKFTGAREYILS